MTPRGETGNDFGVRPTAEGSATLPCPAGCDDGGVLVDSMTLYGIPGGEDWAACEVCRGKGYIASTEGSP